MTDLKKLGIRPNPEFLKIVDLRHRKKWAKSLLNAKVGQAYGSMLDYDDEGNELNCCLMVGHKAFRGTDSQRTNNMPLMKSPFTKAMSNLSDPPIARQGGAEVTATDCNDTHMLTFKQIAYLACPELKKTK